MFIHCRQEGELGKDFTARVRMQVPECDAVPPETCQRLCLTQSEEPLDPLQVGHPADIENPLMLLS